MDIKNNRKSLLILLLLYLNVTVAAKKILVERYED